jgi:hypothetical protein
MTRARSVADIIATAVTSAGTATLTNKTVSADDNTLSGIAASSFVLSDGSGNIDGSASQKTIPSGVVVGDTDTQTLTNKTLTAPIINLAVNAQTGTTYTFVLADNGKLVTASNASAQTYTIPTNSSVAYPTGAQINLIQIDAGQVTIQGDTGVTVSSTGATAATPNLRAQYSTATLIKVATDTWYVIGDIS